MCFSIIYFCGIIGAIFVSILFVYKLNIMNLSQNSDSMRDGDEQPGDQSKSKIIEHKKALKNVSPELEEKLQELNKMGYKNQTFNLVLLKQENGDMAKVIENLKQFYSTS